MNARIPKQLRTAVKASAKRQGISLDELITRILSAYVDSEEKAKPGFLEAWEKFLREHRA